MPRTRHRLRSITSAAIALAATMGLVAGCADSNASENSSSDTDAISITVGTSGGSITSTPVFVAKETGIFEKHGLNVEILAGLRGGTAIMSAISSGDADVANQTVSGAAQARQQGSDTKMLAALTIGVPYALVTKNDSSVPVASDGESGWQDTIKALKGKNIAAGGPASSFDQILKALFLEAGLSGDDFANISTSQGGPQIAALSTGQVDAALVDVSTVEAFEEQADAHVVLTLQSQGPKWVNSQAWGGFITRDSTLAKNPELAAKYQAAIAETQEYYKDPANIDTIMKIAVEQAKVPETPELKTTIAEYAASLTPTFTTVSVETTIDFLLESGQLQQEPAITVGDITTPEVLEG